MTLGEANQIVVDYEGAVKSGFYLRRNLGELVKIRDQLREARVVRQQSGNSAEECEAVLEKINQRIEAKESEAKSEQDAHKAVRQRKIDRRWQIGIAAFAAIVAIVFGVLSYRANKQPPKPASTQADILPSTFPVPRSTPSQPTPAPTATATTAEPTAEPSQTPQLLPPPAP